MRTKYKILAAYIISMGLVSILEAWLGWVTPRDAWQSWLGFSVGLLMWVFGLKEGEGYDD